MKLFYHPHACSLATHIALAESGLPYDIQFVDLATKKTRRGEDYLNINPKGLVPALQLNSGEVLTEVTTILTFVADLVPQQKLIPAAGTLPRYRLMSILSSISMDLHKNFSAFFYPVEIAEWKKVSKQRIDKALGFFNKLLQSNAFLLGESFTVADVYLFVMLHWCDYFAMSLDEWETLKKYQADIAARPSVKQAFFNEQ